MRLDLFMLSSAVEFIGLYTLMFAVFRLRFKEYIWSLISVSTLINGINYFLIKEKLYYFSPIVFIVLTFLILFTFVGISAFWSFIVAISGYVAIGLIETILILPFHKFMQTTGNEWKNYALYVVAGIISYVISSILYNRGIGFSFNFEKARFKQEKWFVYIILGAITIIMSIMLFYTKTIYLAICAVILIIVVGLLILYSIKKEKEETERYLKEVKKR